MSWMDDAVNIKYFNISPNYSSEETHEYIEVDEEKIFMREMELLHINRRRHLDEICCKYGMCSNDKSKPHGEDFYSDTYKVG